MLQMIIISIQNNLYNMKATLDYWNPENKTIVTEDGFRYLSKKSVITSTKDIEANNNIELFEQFYKLNNSLRYCNGSYYKFQDKLLEELYNVWLKSDDYKKKSFDLFYGNGTVD
jgi:hypothetical protein